MGFDKEERVIRKRTMKTIVDIKRQLPREIIYPSWLVFANMRLVGSSLYVASLKKLCGDFYHVHQ